MLTYGLRIMFKIMVQHINFKKFGEIPHILFLSLVMYLNLYKRILHLFFVIQKDMVTGYASATIEEGEIGME